MRSARWAAALFFAAVWSLAGCNATTPAATEPAAIFMAPEYPTLKLETLAYLGLATMVPDPVGVPTTDALLKSYLTGGQQSFIVIDESACRARARKNGIDADLDKVIRVWKDSHTVDRFLLKEMGDKIGVDGIVFGDLTQWREEQVDWTSEGTSFTEVGIALSIYDCSTGILAWKGEKKERRESPHYEHAQGTGSGVYVQPGTGAERTERADKLTPKPPPATEVAESVVQALMQSLPAKPASKT